MVLLRSLGIPARFVTGYVGGDTTTTPGDMRFLLDLVGAFTVSPAFGLNLNVDYIKAFDDISSDYQIGGSLMGRYVISDRLNFAARGEYLATHYAAAPGLGRWPMSSASLTADSRWVKVPRNASFAIRSW